PGQIMRRNLPLWRDLDDPQPVGVADIDVPGGVDCSAAGRRRVGEALDRLCDADHAWLFRREGETCRWAASYGHSKEDRERIKQYMLTLQLAPGRGSVVGRAALEGRPSSARSSRRSISLESGLFWRRAQRAHPRYATTMMGSAQRVIS